MAKVLHVGVQTRPVALSPRSERALKNIEKYDWILFTSKNTVEYFAQRVSYKRVETKVAAVGPVTADALRKFKIPVDVVPKENTVKALVASLGKIRGKKLLFPRSNIAPIDVVRDMRRLGAQVTVVPLYTTTPSPLFKNELRDLREKKYTALTFKSPSGIRGLLGQLSSDERKYARALEAVCIGETTAEAARKAGFKRVRVGKIKTSSVV